MGRVLKFGCGIFAALFLLGVAGSCLIAWDIKNEVGNAVDASASPAKQSSMQRTRRSASVAMAARPSATQRKLSRPPKASRSC